jgi:uncharacterized repeat protein (TIGR02543 family)
MENSDDVGDQTGVIYYWNLVGLDQFDYVTVNPNISGTIYDNFGNVLTANNDYVLVGAETMPTEIGEGSGMAFLLDVTNGDILRIFENENLDGDNLYDSFGVSVGINNSDDMLIRGTGEYSALDENYGVVYRYLPEYTATFDNNGGYGVTSITNSFGTSIIIPPAPTKTEYTFVGWYDEELTTLFTFIGHPMYEDITLYAKWAAPEGNPVVLTPTDEGLTTIQIVGLSVVGVLAIILLVNNTRKPSARKGSKK